MGEVRSENNQGIKLFGATIKLHGEEAKQEKRGNEDQMVENSSEKIIACPRCKSMETKFCYFNNYNVNQPRHFCKSCQRYWTAGGVLRNVPVGAGRRKTKSPCSEAGGSPESCLYENSDDDHVFGLEQGLVLDKWNSDFRQVFPGKRRRTTSSGGYSSASESITHSLSSTKTQNLELYIDMRRGFKSFNRQRTKTHPMYSYVNKEKTPMMFKFNHEET